MVFSMGLNLLVIALPVESVNWSGDSPQHYITQTAYHSQIGSIAISYSADTNTQPGNCRFFCCCCGFAQSLMYLPGVCHIMPWQLPFTLPIDYLLIIPPLFCFPMLKLLSSNLQINK